MISGIVLNEIEPLALSLTLRDMGNRVVRLEGYTLIPVRLAKAEQDLHGREVMNFPLADRVDDSARIALELLRNVSVQSFSAGCFRSVNETTTEICLW